MKLLQLEFGFVMDEESKDIYRTKGAELIPSSQEEYDRYVKFIAKMASLWNDATEVDNIPDDVYIDEVKNVYYKVDEGNIVIWKIYEGSEFLEPKIMQLIVVDLEDLKILLSNESIIQCLIDLNVGFEPKVDGNWRIEFIEYCDSLYKVSYKIDSQNISLGIKKVIVKKEPARMHSKPKAKRPSWLDR